MSQPPEHAVKRDVERDLKQDSGGERWENQLLAALYALLQIDAEWSVIEDGSFTWWPFEYPQTLSAHRDRNGDTWVQARTVLVTDVEDPAVARHLCSLLNAGAAGYAFHLDRSQRRVLLDTTANLPVAPGFMRAAFSQSVIAQALAAQNTGRLLADATGGIPGIRPHPTSGSRPRPDEMLTLLVHDWARPEPALGTDVTSADLEAVAHTLAAMMEIEVGEGDHDVWLLDENRLIIFNQPATLDAGGAAETLLDLSVHVRVSDHPEFGRTFSVVVTTPLGVEEGSVDALVLADHLNREAADVPAQWRATLGGWWVRDGGQLCFSSYLLAGAVASLRGDERDARAGQLAAAVVEVMATRGRDLSRVAAEHGARFTGDTRPWIGLKHETGIPLTVLPERNEARLQIARHLRAHPDAPLEVDLSDLGAGPDIPLGLWGIFNPVGPTLTTLGLVATDEGWLFSEWMRHPTGAHYRVHGVLDDLTDEAAESACERFLVDTYGTDACPVPFSLPEFVYPSPDGSVGEHVDHALQRIAVTRCDSADLTASAVIYGAFNGDAWARMNAPETVYTAMTRYLRDLTPTDAAHAWWTAATNDAHLAGHAAAFPSAWDGSNDFLRSLTEAPSDSETTTALTGKSDA